ncbi:MAG: PD40 domain-containing protein, partial [Anaerolineae bacterium]|nr:PD40 domain-containing protein [Anaerolineae bacterium]
CVMVWHGIDGSAEMIALGSNGVRDSRSLSSRISQVLTSGVDYDWSPDGRRIATTGRDGNIQIVDLQTNSLQSIVPCDHCLVTGLRWSPDSSRLFFSDVDSLYVVYPDTEKIELVGASWGVSSTQQTYWLPDGKSLVFEGSRSYGPILYRLTDNEKPPYHEPVTFGDETKRWTVSYLFWTSQEVSSRSLQ